MRKDISWQESNVHDDDNNNDNIDNINNDNNNNHDNDYSSENQYDGCNYFHFQHDNNDELFEIFEYKLNLPPNNHNKNDDDNNNDDDDNNNNDNDDDDKKKKKRIATTTNTNTNTTNSTTNTNNTTNTTNNTTITLKLKSQADINTSTGLSIWLGSETMSQFLLQNSHYVYNKQVLELGSGIGLCGLTAYYLHAKRVILTDGDIHVLHNLRLNVRQNINNNVKETFWNGCDDTVRSVKDDNDNDNDNHNNDNNIDNNIISCPQHIWGKNIPQFINTYGKSNVIIATDCVYIPQSLKPFWQSIDQLLVDNDDDDNDGNDDNDNDDNDNNTSNISNSIRNTGMVIYTNRCASAAPIERVLEMATEFGFKWTTISFHYYNNNNSNNDNSNNDNCNNDNSNNDTMDLSDRIFIFTRDKKDKKKRQKK